MLIVASTHAHHAGLNHIFYHAFSFLGVPDHTGGIVLLIAVLFLRIGQFILINKPRKLY